MQKYTQSEGKLQVLRGRAAQVLHQHFAKTGKNAVSDFSEDERKDFDTALEDAQKQDEAEQKQELAAAKKAQKLAAQDLPEVQLAKATETEST